MDRKSLLKQYSKFDAALKRSLSLVCCVLCFRYEEIMFKADDETRIHKAFQLEVCDQYNEKLSKGRLKVPQIGFLYLL